MSPQKTRSRKTKRSSVVETTDAESVPVDPQPESSVAPDQDTEPTSVEPTTTLKLVDMKSRFERLKSLREESKQANRKDVHKEYVKSKENNRVSIKQDRKREDAEELLRKQEALKKGEDYERIKNLQYTAEDVELWNAKQQAKQGRMERGFTDFVQVQAKKYERMISDFKPNLQKYKEQVARSAGGDESNSDLHTVYRGAHSLAYADPTSKPSSEALERVKEEIVKQDRRRAKFTKRKAVNEDDDITYINERNRRFNEQVSKAFDKYTEEIRDNFERGTAL